MCSSDLNVFNQTLIEETRLCEKLLIKEILNDRLFYVENTVGDISIVKYDIKKFKQKNVYVNNNEQNIIPWQFSTRLQGSFWINQRYQTEEKVSIFRKN